MIARPACLVRRAVSLSLALAGALVVALPAAASKKVYRCEAGGRVVYQQTACNVGADPAAGAASAPAGSAAAVKRGASGPEGTAAKPPASARR